MEKYIHQRASSKWALCSRALSPENHISVFCMEPHKIFKLFNINTKKKSWAEKEWAPSVGRKNNIFAWSSDEMAVDADGNKLDLMIFSNGATMIWCAFIDFLLFKEMLKECEGKVANLSFGYITGTRSPMGIYSRGFSSSEETPGYELWIEINK